MTLVHILIIGRPPHKSRSHGVGVTYRLVKLSMIPRDKLGINLRANIFGNSNESYKFQDNHLGNNNPIGVPFTSLYAVKLRFKGSDKLFLNTTRQYVIPLG